MSANASANPPGVVDTDRLVAVAVNSGQPTRVAFTYLLPEGLEAEPGQAVFVPYGSRVLQGIVLERGVTPDVAIEDVRPIAAVAEPEPVLDATHVALARWMSETYLAPLWDCVAACLPSGYGQKAVTMVSPVEVPPLLPVYPKDQKILQYIAAHGRVPVDRLRESVGQVSMETLRRLQDAGHLTVVQGLARPTGKARFERRVRLTKTTDEARAHAAELEEKAARSVAARVLKVLAELEDVPLGELRAAGAGPSHLSALAEDGWLEQYEQQVERDPLEGWRFEPRGELVLTEDQQRAADAIWERGGTSLVHGITGSGKTEVYLDLVMRTLAEGKGAIVLVPEISLTPQAIRRYGERFGETLTVLHSQLSTGELFDQWYRIERGDARVVIGSRSALFAPVPDLGLVVMDEEHEWSYKQVDPQPRYHARDVASELCRLTGARLVLGSATPDIVTYHRSEIGQIGRVELHRRVAPRPDGTLGEGKLPLVSVVDMREELRRGNRSVFSIALHAAVEEALANGEQAILFVNRRGSARFMLCRDCGYLPVCPTCEVAMSLNLSDPLHPQLRCHHCGRTKRQEDECPKCGGYRYRPFGVGTQRIEMEARKAFPNARVARWDSDVASRKGAHERMVQALEAHEIDLLVGTQMLAKGLDLPQMMVVGVVDADVGMSLPDFHAHERTFQLLSQVAGRAGRRDREGLVFFQTYEPEAPPIVCAANHDYRGFFEDEIAHRRRAGYPPFSRMVRLLHRNSKYEHGLQEASRVAQELRMRRDAAGRGEPDVLGPTPAYIARIRGEYRWQILLRGRNPASLVEQVRLGDRWAIDVDPANLT